MKKLIVLPLSLLWAIPAHAEDLWVQVRESLIRAQPAFYAAPVTSVKYGDRLERVGEEKGWIKVRSGRKEGYVPVAVVTPQQIVLSGHSVSKVNADASDVVLAGKGFSKEVEAEYKRSDSSARFDLVDQVERQTAVPRAEVQQFMKSGGLKG
jgi:hypothetical protein